jgi:predicted nucleic acid-binding protein
MSPEARALVIDASIGIAVVRKEPGWKGALDALRLRRVAGSPLLVPSLFWLELVNVLCRRYRLKPGIVIEAIVELEIMGVESVELERPMVLLTLDAIGRHGLTAYAATYLVLAQTADADLLTLDARLMTAAGDRAIRFDSGHSVGGSSPPHEAPANRPTWADWPGAAKYLGELRARIPTPSVEI